MSNQPVAVTLLDRVQRRLQTASFARSLHYWTLGSLVAAAVVVLTVRLLGLLPENQQRLQWLLVLPAAAALGAWLFHRRVERTVAARAVDAHARTNDLFLTLATLSSSAGEYQPLVEKSAESVATRIVPATVVPFKPERPAGIQLAAIAVLALLILLVPTLDPLGKVEAANKVQNRKQEIERIRKVVKQREETVTKKVEAGEEREKQISERMNEMMGALKKMKPQEQKPNSQVLNKNRESLNDLWKSVSTEDLREMLSQAVSEQQFGGSRQQKMNEWLKQLQEGKADALKQELQKAQETMEAMMEARTPEERQKLASQLRKQLQDLKKFSSEKAGSKDMEEALNQALKSLEAMAQKKSGEGEEGEPMSQEEQEMAQEAAKALKESMELAKTELQEIERSAKDMKQLEEALKTLQQAEKLNQKGEMDGEACENCKSISEYAEMLAQMGGMGTDGQAERDTPGAMQEEDDSDPEGYKEEKAKTQLQAGKVLLSIKTREAATEKDFDPEDLKKYESSVTEIKAGVQAAIEAEQIPPGYVDGIKSYFDSIDASAAPAPQASPEPTAPAEDARSRAVRSL